MLLNFLKLLALHRWNRNLILCQITLSFPKESNNLYTNDKKCIFQLESYKAKLDYSRCFLSGAVQRVRPPCFLDLDYSLSLSLSMAAGSCIKAKWRSDSCGHSYILPPLPTHTHIHTPWTGMAGIFMPSKHSGLLTGTEY